ITTSTATATVQVSSAMGVKKVEFYVDDTKVGTDSTGPYAYTYNLSAVSNGYHTLTAKIYDIVDNTNQTSITVNIKLDKPPVIESITPPPAITLTKSDFPYTLTAEAVAAAGIKNVKFYAASDLVGTVLPKNGSTFSIGWSYPGAGSYQVYATVLDTQDRTTSTSRASVTVE
ncbi:MAG: Ig-like domain-containing protein, partial [Parcubacteria group bacterium]